MEKEFNKKKSFTLAIIEFIQRNGSKISLALVLLSEVIMGEGCFPRVRSHSLYEAAVGWVKTESQQGSLERAAPEKRAETEKDYSEEQGE